MDITTIVPIRAFQDNYIWCLRRGSTAVVVDPGDAAPVLEYLADEGLQLAAILTTHHHGDYVGGNTALLAKYNVPVFGPAREDIPGITRQLREGDALFSCGCGKLFEGTAMQMHSSLSKLAALPGNTLVYCGHEYTLSNLRFARAADPDNAAIAQREASARAALANGRPSLASTIESELAANPFLRSGNPAVATSASRFAGRKLDEAGRRVYNTAQVEG